ncbi:MAG: hypothetical protein ACAI25_13235 [Planctomycetota bacterium]
MVALVVLFASGCVSYTADKLPKRTYGEVVAKRRVAVDYDLNVTWHHNPSPNEQWIEKAREQFEKVTRQAQSFTSIRQGRGSPWHLSVTFDNSGGDDGTAVLCGLTLFLFPAFAREDFTLSVDLFHNGQLVKSYSYNDGMTTVIEIFLIFVSPFFSPIGMGEAVADNMVLNFLYDLSKDDLLTDDGPRKPSSSTPTPPPEETPPPTFEPPAPNAPAANAPPANKDDR